MEISYEKDHVCLKGVKQFDEKRIFECGQAFRFDPCDNGGYMGVAFGSVLRVTRDGDTVRLYGATQESFEKIWFDYFDLERDYDSVASALSIDDTMRKATKCGYGIRILRQDPFEALISFIISQNNNIPRIKGIVNRLCSMFGTPCGDTGFYSFPDAPTLAALSKEQLAPLRAGFRDDYILCAARSVASGETDLQALKKCSYEQAVTELKKLRGVGPKVADCVALFGLGHIEAFPIDVWMKRILQQYYNTPDFTPEIFAPYGGIAQQYLFYFARQNALN